MEIRVDTEARADMEAKVGMEARRDTEVRETTEVRPRRRALVPARCSLQVPVVSLWVLLVVPL